MKKFNDKRETNIICVNSIKGGAGKTTIALSLACTLLQELENAYHEKKVNILRLAKMDIDNAKSINQNFIEEEMKINEKMLKDLDELVPRICFIDFDILGTGTKHIFYGDDPMLFDHEIKYFNSWKSIEGFKNYINHLELEGQQFNIDCIIMNEDPKEKNNFIKNARTHTSKVNLNIFEARAKQLLSDIAEKNCYDFIIIDSSPSYESFTRGIYEHITNTIQHKHKEVTKILNLFISTFDKAHVMNTLNSIIEILNTDPNNAYIRMVLNNTLNPFYDNEAKTYNFDEESKLIDNVFNKFERLRREPMNAKYQPSESTFKRKSIIVKKHSTIAQNMLLGNGMQLNKTTMYKELLDRDLLINLKLIEESTSTLSES